MQTLPPIDHNIAAGVDVGGTKVHIADTASHAVHRFSTTDYPNLDAILEEYFTQINARPARVAVGMAGPRDDDTGEIKLTNGDWPVFNPADASEKYGIKFATANDMVATTAGVLVETGIDLLQLKSGTPAKTGTKLVISLSTGIGVAAAVWDAHSKRYVIVATEAGHISFQPKDAEEQQYLTYLHAKYPHASAELALSGKHGIENLVDHYLEHKQELKLTQAIDRARQANRPVGAVLLEFATEGQGADRQAAHDVLARLGAMVGSVIRDLMLAYNAAGGVYLGGSVSLALGEYFAENTEMNNRIIRPGAVFDEHVTKIPVHLVTNPNVAVLGALEMAKQIAP